MFKGKFVVLTLLVVVVALSWQLMPGADTAYSGVVDAENSDATVAAGPHCFLIDPVAGGLTVTLNTIGAPITVTALDNIGGPIPDIPAQDFWLIGENDAVLLCGGSGSINATGPSNASGIAQITGALRGGGWDTGVQVVIQSVVVLAPGGGPHVLPITVVSPDIDGTIEVGLADFSAFKNGTVDFPGSGFQSPPKVYNPRLDFDCNAAVGLSDFAIFKQSFNKADCAG